MSSIDALNLELVSQDPEEWLRQRLRALGARPFHQQVVQSPWSVVYDADLLYQEVKGLITCVVDGCGQQDVVRCLTVIAPPGYGKTHLIAWNRQRLEYSQRAVFVYVPPYSPDSGPFENHVLRAALDSLRLHSPWQTARLNERVWSFLVDAYDEYIAAGRPLARLRAGGFWTRLLRPLSLCIGARDRDDQLAALQCAFRYRDLLAFAFNRFTEQHPAGAEGLRPDWDTFVAIAHLVCGNPTQHWHAKQWLQNEPMPPEVWAPYHFQERCQGTDKVRNGLFTLMHLVGLPFCLTLDQVEDTIEAVLQHPATPWNPLTLLLVRLSSVPGFSLLFFVQAGVWQALSSNIPPMLRDRITEGYNVQLLRSLDDAAARAIVRARMDAFVWRELDAEGAVPPADRPLFPFTVEEVSQLRRDANSELRPFLRLLQDRYAQLIAPSPPPAPVITAILPGQVPPDEPKAVRIQGNHFRPEVSVSLAGRPITPVTYHPNEGSTEVIEITTPVGFLGEVEVRVQAVDDSRRFATTKLLFVDPPPRPYSQYVDRQKMRQRRSDELKLNQTQLGDLVGVNQARISAFERGKWHPSDDFIERLAQALGCTIADFRKDANGGGV
jgi:DNA-binding XRE family transcriptional regulator